MLTKLIESATTTVTGVEQKIRTDRSRDEALIQVDIVGGSATVIIEGRIGQTFQWIVVSTVTASSLIPITRVAEIRCRITAISGATVDAGIHLDT